MSTTLDYLYSLGQQIDTESLTLRKLDAYYSNQPPIAFLSPKARESLGNSLDLLAVNIPRLAISTLSERLKITGFRVADSDTTDSDLWRIWRRNGLPDQSACAHIDSLVLGRSFLIVWAGDTPDTPRVSCESAHQVAVARDPATRLVTCAVKRWVEDGHARATVFELDKITKLVSESRVVSGAGIPYVGWHSTEVIDNPLGVVPVVPLVNRDRLLMVDGVSEIADLAPLCDALTKLLTDLMITSEAYSRPRRFASGIELVEEIGPDGEPTGQFINPFASDLLRVWMAENPETKFGQFPQADLSSYQQAVDTIIRLIASMAALPPHIISALPTSNPTSADAIRSAESALVQRAEARQRAFGSGWAEVARLIIAVRDGIDTSDLEIEPIWASAETKSVAQETDAVVKLVQAKILPVSSALERLGYTGTEIDRIATQRVTDSLDAQGIDLSGIGGGTPPAPPAVEP